MKERRRKHHAEIGRWKIGWSSGTTWRPFFVPYFSVLSSGFLSSCYTCATRQTSPNNGRSYFACVGASRNKADTEFDCWTRIKATAVSRIFEEFSYSLARVLVLNRVARAIRAARTNTAPRYSDSIRFPEERETFLLNISPLNITFLRSLAWHSR